MMRYRKLDNTGDFCFGHGNLDYYQDCPEAVAQAVKTRLALWAGEWFLDQEEGTPWGLRVLGKNRAEDYDPLIRLRILETQGVSSISSYESVWDADSRALAIDVTIDTIYGATSVSGELQGVGYV